ncbi:MAG TPA: AbrB/MazE/SpoVT family DNA-binding domain-containing protein [Longimicrobiaceae bacterium]|nr:AbrB/MazE/SpoVT family DNA-binding domain-containing protein [Longimicrobiaceae bacterium]
MTTARLSSKSQIVIPAEIRRQLGLKAGDRVTLMVEGDQVILKKQAEEDPLERLRALGGPAWKGAAEEIQRAREEWDR